VPPTSTSTDPAPASPGIGERGPTPVYPSTSPSSWLALCLSISPASFVPPFPPLSCRLLLLLSIPICCACPGRKLAISTPSSFGTNRVTRGCHTSLLDVVNCLRAPIQPQTAPAVPSAVLAPAAPALPPAALHPIATPPTPAAHARRRLDRLTGCSTLSPPRLRLSLAPPFQLPHPRIPWLLPELLHPPTSAFRLVSESRC
jgi:hypothetical protein